MDEISTPRVFIYAPDTSCGPYPSALDVDNEELYKKLCKDYEFNLRFFGGNDYLARALISAEYPSCSVIDFDGRRRDELWIEARSNPYFIKGSKQLIGVLQQDPDTRESLKEKADMFFSFSRQYDRRMNKELVGRELFSLGVNLPRYGTLAGAFAALIFNTAVVGLSVPLVCSLVSIVLGARGEGLIKEAIRTRAEPSANNMLVYSVRKGDLEDFFYSARRGNV